jgi:hypothetical protein
MIYLFIFTVYTTALFLDLIISIEHTHTYCTIVCPCFPIHRNYHCSTWLYSLQLHRGQFTPELTSQHTWNSGVKPWTQCLRLKPRVDASPSQVCGGPPLQVYSKCMDPKFDQGPSSGLGPSGLRIRPEMWSQGTKDFTQQQYCGAGAV